MFCQSLPGLRNKKLAFHQRFRPFRCIKHCKSQCFVLIFFQKPPPHGGPLSLFTLVFLHPNGGCWGFLNHQQYHVFPKFPQVEGDSWLSLLLGGFFPRTGNKKTESFRGFLNFLDFAKDLLPLLFQDLTGPSSVFGGVNFAKQRKKYINTKVRLQNKHSFTISPLFHHALRLQAPRRKAFPSSFSNSPGYTGPFQQGKLISSTNYQRPVRHTQPKNHRKCFTNLLAH